MKVITGYRIVWMYDQDMREPVRLSIEGGIEALRQWRDGAPMIIVKMKGESTKRIRSIEPIYLVDNDYSNPATQAFENGIGKKEEDVQKMLQGVLMSDVSALPAPTQGQLEGGEA